jgi:type I restriction enzyme S subunit
MSALEHHIPEGFKQTEVGVIPDEWEVKALGDITSIERGKFSARPRNDPKFFGGSIPFIQTGDITRSNGRNVTYSQTLNNKGLAVSRLFPANSLYFTIAANIGDVAIVNYQSACPDSLVVIKQKQNIDKEWLYHSLSDKKAEFEVIATSNAQLNINLEKLNPYKLPIPSKEEQTAIANALSDVDMLLTELAYLIAKKQAIKTATMQQLLTGKTRLPQFATYTEGEKKGQRKSTKPSERGHIPEDWEVRAFGQVMRIRHGKDQKAIQVNDGQYPIFGTGGQMGTTNTYLYNKPSVLIGRKGTINKPRFIDTPFWTVDTLFYSEVPNKESAKFIYYKFCMIDWMQYNEASGVPSLNASTIENVLASFPKLREQTAIATILSDMDDEIKNLEQRLKKTRQIKQGMMQELLTGRTRLPFDKNQGNKDV